MYTDAQARKFVEKLGLSYRIECLNGHANYIIVEETIVYSPYTSKLRIEKDGKVIENIPTNTRIKFKELCDKLAKNKLSQ